MLGLISEHFDETKVMLARDRGPNLLDNNFPRSKCPDLMDSACTHVGKQVCPPRAVTSRIWIGIIKGKLAWRKAMNTNLATRGH